MARYRAFAKRTRAPLRFAIFTLCAGAVTVTVQDPLFSKAFSPGRVNRKAYQKHQRQQYQVLTAYALPTIAIIADNRRAIAEQNRHFPLQSLSSFQWVTISTPPTVAIIARIARSISQNRRIARTAIK